MRETDSLCPICVREARQEILDGKRDYSVLLHEKIGEGHIGTDAFHSEPRGPLRSD